MLTHYILSEEITEKRIIENHFDKFYDINIINMYKTLYKYFVIVL